MEMGTPGAINVYTCDACRGRITTRTRDEGCVPFKFLCGCGGALVAAFGRVDQSIVPLYEWWMPVTTREWRTICNRSLWEHVALGRLLLRRL